VAGQHKEHLAGPDARATAASDDTCLFSLEAFRN